MIGWLERGRHCALKAAHWDDDYMEELAKDTAYLERIREALIGVPDFRTMLGYELPPERVVGS